MKLKISHNQLQGMPPAQWLRRTGYTFLTDRHSGQESFVRRLGGDFYPRFHLYIQEVPGSEEVFFNLHLDQKKASYAGITRHSGEYEGELVEQEVARLRSYLSPRAEVARPETQSQAPRDVLESLRPQELIERPPEKKLPWWKRIFS
ncbi:MAG: hypothetical protein ACM3PZ_03520 [Bacillota bacterium]